MIDNTPAGAATGPLRHWIPVATENPTPLEQGSRAVAALRLGMVMCGLALLVACDAEDEAQSRRGQGGPPGGRGGRSPGGRPAAAAIPVKAEPVVRKDLFAYLETYARLEAERQVTVLSRTTGLVQRLRVEEGDSVRQGQVLLELDPEESDLRVRRSRAEYEESSSSFERFKDLHDNRMVSQAQFEAARLRFDSSKIDLEEAEMNLAHTTVRAPMGGVITRRLVEVGDLVRANQEVCVVADLDLLLARVFIPERRMYQVRPGQSATIGVDALPGRSFDARIRMVSPEVIAESGTVKVTLEVPASGQLKPGMFATVRLITARHPQTLVMPRKALVLETEEDDVFVVADSAVTRVAVELGLIEGGYVEVLSGVVEGDMLVTVGYDGLKEGAAVRIVGLQTAMTAATDDSDPEPPQTPTGGERP